MEQNIDAYLRGELPLKEATRFVNPHSTTGLAGDETADCTATLVPLSANRCESPGDQRNAIYHSKNERGRLVFVNE
jgi:hypothetical protein